MVQSVLFTSGSSSPQTVYDITVSAPGLMNGETAPTPSVSSLVYFGRMMSSH